MSSPAVETPDTEEETGTRRGFDGELRVINTMIRQLEDLEDAVQTRVMNYLNARFNHPKV